ncbi:ABC transporter ATP-binding protein [Consotaella salsifontis]|nr:ABC transporter ATP-binding protein [Consotaella salsifontis]
MSAAVMTKAGAPLAEDDPDIILAVDGLETHFGRPPRVAKAVDDVTFRVRAGETVAVVGESGSGKSVASLSIMQLLARGGRIAGGSIRFRQRSGTMIALDKLSQKEMRKIRGAEIAMIFQEPMTSLNPLMTIGDQIAEMTMLHEPIGRTKALEHARQMLELVEIPAAGNRLGDYPHQLSGGMRQRVMIALALACKPRLLIADEPTTALDVTIQKQILRLLERLQAEMGMSMLFITHNLGVVAEIAHEVVVMYAGRVVEQAPMRELFRKPRHPYTLGLLHATPNPARDLAPSAGGEPAVRRRLTPIPGNVPSTTELPDGCSFAPRCPLRIDACEARKPPLVKVDPDHASRCIRHEELS